MGHFYFIQFCRKKIEVSKGLKCVFLFLIIFSFAFKGFSQNFFFNSRADFFNADSGLVSWNNSDLDNLSHNYNCKFLYQTVEQYHNIGGVNDVGSCLRSSFFNTGYDSYGDYTINSAIFSHYVKSTYFTRLKYLSGTKKEQVFSIEHQQRFLRVMQAGVFYRGLASPGFYKREFNKIKNFAGYLNFSSINKKYDATVYYFTNVISTQESGGVVADSLLKRYVGQELTIPVNLNVSEHRVRVKGYCLNQFYDFKRSRQVDSLTSDTLSGCYFRIGHVAEWSKQSFVFLSGEVDSNYYYNHFLSDVGTHDSLYFEKLSNRVELSLNEFSLDKNKKVSVGLKAGVELASYRMHQEVLDSSFISNAMDLCLIITTNKKWRFLSSYKKLFYHTIENPFIAETLVDFKVGKFVSRVGVDYRNQVLPSDFVSQQYYSNHFVWKNNFGNRHEVRYKVFAGLFDDRVVMSVSDYVSRGTVFYDELFEIPQQYNGVVELLKGQLSTHIKLGNWHWLGENTYNFSGDDLLIRCPMFELSNSFYYEGYFFKKALLASIGGHCYYTSAYYADAFIPATGQFYVQHEVKVGDYPYLGVFLNMKIKTARIFFKVEHVNAGIGERTYFYMPHYPTPPRTLKFGIIWSFNN